MIEEWRDIPGYEGFYEVSNVGNVRSKDRLVLHDSVKGLFRRIRSRQLKPTLTGAGYYHIGLRKDGSIKFIGVHRLVLMAFVGPPPSDGMEACHFPDRDPKNNNINNLRWGTVIENKADQKLHGTDNAGERNGSSKLTENQVRSIRTMYASGRWTMKRLGNEFNCNATTICLIVNRVKWKHVK